MESQQKTSPQQSTFIKSLLLSILVCASSFSSVFALADLQVLRTSVQTNSETSTVLLDIEIINNGPAVASNAKLRLHLYSGQTTINVQEVNLQPLEMNIARTERVGLASAGSEYGNINVEIFDEVEPDIRPSNNSLLLSFQMPGVQTSDLELMDVVVLSEQPVKDRILKLQIQYKNSGPAKVRNVILKTDLSQFQKSLSYQEKKLGKLDVGEEKQIRIAMLIPVDGIPVQDTLLKVSIAALDSEIRDPDEINNSIELAPAISVRVADLVLSDVRVDSRGSLSFSILNKGTAPAKESVTVLYINGAMMRRYNTPALVPGRERTHQFGGAKILPGTKVTIVLDFNADVPEVSEENNRLEMRK